MVSFELTFDIFGPPLTMSHDLRSTSEQVRGQKKPMQDGMFLLTQGTVFWFGSERRIGMLRIPADSENPSK